MQQHHCKTVKRLRGREKTHGSQEQNTKVSFLRNGCIDAILMTLKILKKKKNCRFEKTIYLCAAN